MKQKIYLLLLSLSLFFARNASAFCEGVDTSVYITTNLGTVKYITTRSRQDFIKASPHPVSPNTLGLTVSHMNITGSATPNVENENGKTCISLKTVELKIENDELTVYIDKKYKPGTCEYKTIKNHEKYHVAVAQQALIFFKPDIEAQVQKSLRNIKPQIVASNAEADAVFKRQFNQVLNELKPLIEHINKKTAEKNYLIDTPESYAQTKALCQNW